MVSIAARGLVQSLNYSSRSISTLLQPTVGVPSVGEPKPSKTGHLEGVWGKIKDRNLQTKLTRSSALHGDMAPRNPVHLPSQSGFAGAVKGVLMSFQEL